MGNFDKYEVNGYLRKIESDSKKLILDLKVNCDMWDVLCGFCQTGNSTDKSQNRTHAHDVKGFFKVTTSNNEITISLEDCGKNKIYPVPEEFSRNTAETTPSQPPPLLPALSSPIEQMIPKFPTASTLQYEVDGKVYELKRSAVRVHRKVSHAAKKNLQQSENQTSKPHPANKISTKPFEGVNDRDQKEVKKSLEQLKVKLMDKSMIPDSIVCGPDTPTFLQNMKQLAKVASASQANYRCEQCNDELSSYFPYVEHVFKHLGTRPYVCSLCQSTFQSRAVMRHHLDMHSGRTPFQCEFCDKKFRNSCHMKQHRLRHTGERPYPCSYCNKSFAHKNVLKIHMQSHTGEKPCQCDLCGKLFREPHRLACHLSTHYRPSKTMECQNCGKNFKTNRMLKLHTEKRCKGQNALGADESGNTISNGTTAEIELEVEDVNQQVTIFEAKTLEDGTMSYIVDVEPSSGQMVVEFATCIDSDEAEGDS